MFYDFIAYQKKKKPSNFICFIKHTMNNFSFLEDLQFDCTHLHPT